MRTLAMARRLPRKHEGGIDVTPTSMAVSVAMKNAQNDDPAGALIVLVVTLAVCLVIWWKER